MWWIYKKAVNFTKKELPLQVRLAVPGDRSHTRGSRPVDRSLQ